MRKISVLAPLKRWWEYFREAAVLVLVFALLDKLISPHGKSDDWILGTILVSFGLLVAGAERGQ
jgi:hypothetical protein